VILTSFIPACIPIGGTNDKAPIADFSADRTIINVGESVNFIDLSTKSPTSWQWTFEGVSPDGSNLQNPVGIQYNTPGIYSVKLKVTNAYGSNIKNKIEYIVVNSLLPTFIYTTQNQPVNITNTTASAGGTIETEGTSTIIARGVCWKNSPGPTIADNKTINGVGIGSFTGELTGLTANTTYYVRPYATNSSGTAYGVEIAFTTTGGGLSIVTDIDGNIYNTVQIGTQTWMVENLKTTRYNDGTIIPNVIGNGEWIALTSGAYCFYNNDISNNNIYGKLYNGYAVNTGKLAPTGWHVPTEDEIRSLKTILGGNVAGATMKSTSSLWAFPNEGATNSSGFTGLPGGVRSTNGGGTFSNINFDAYFWTSSNIDVQSTSNNWLFKLSKYNTYMNIDLFNITNGMSVRCIKD
jgi:uncharacterized protein (TIGR02145 family)